MIDVRRAAWWALSDTDVTGRALSNNGLTADYMAMSLLVDALVGKQIDSALADSEVTYIMLTDGTQITIRGLIIVEPARAEGPMPQGFPCSL
jgi:hypothetical protein